MIKIFLTGGTFEKKYNEITGELVFAKSYLSEMLALGRCKIPYSINMLMLIDSLDMTEEDRSLIAENCAEAEEKQIIITHGTDTMVQTARRIKRELEKQNITDKAIILTGAMVPFSIKDSDAMFNIGNAIGGVQNITPGVYVAMNGKFFEADNVRKNREKGFFE